MSKNEARLGDKTDHGGTIITGSPNTFVNGIPAARVTDKHMCPIHGLNMIIEGAPHATINGLNAARIGDRCACGAKIIQGSPNTFVGDN